MAYRSVVTGTGANDTLNLDVSGAGIQDGDELIGIVRSAETVTWSGFTPAVTSCTVDGNVTRAGTTQIFRKRASSEGSSYTVAIGGGNGVAFNVILVIVSGRTNTAPTITTTNDAAEGASPQNIPLTGVTAADGDDIILVNAGESGNAAGTWAITSVPTNYTSRGTATLTGVFSGGFINVATRDNVAAGATGTLTSVATLAGQSVETYGAVIRLASAGGGGPVEATISNASPQASPVTMNGRAATVNSFSTITIREVLVNEAGSPVANRTGMSLLVWYAGNPVGAPDLSYSALTTDAAGTASWNIATGGLSYNQTIFYVATDGGASLSQYTCARLVPTYS